MIHPAPVDSLFHVSDPAPSRLAAQRHVASGRCANNAAVVLDLVRGHPHKTACELWELASDNDRAQLKELQEIRRRISGMKSLIVSSGERRCMVRGTPQTTWTVTP